MSIRNAVSNLSNGNSLHASQPDWRRFLDYGFWVGKAKGWYCLRRDVSWTWKIAMAVAKPLNGHRFLGMDPVWNRSGCSPHVWVDSQNKPRRATKHFCTTRNVQCKLYANCINQSANERANQMSITPRHSESNLTRTKWWKGGASDLENNTAPQRPTHTHSDVRVARAHVRFSPNTAGATKHEQWKCENRLRPFFRRSLWSTATATKNEPEASAVLHLPRKMVTMCQIKNRDSFTLSSTNIPPATKNDLRNHLWFGTGLPTL